MNFLQHIYPGDLMASFAIRVLAEITLVTAIAFLLARTIARNNAALRHGICICALLFVVSAPVTTLGLEQLGWSTFSIRLESEKQQLTTVAIPYGEKVVPAAAPLTRPFWTLERARDAASLIILLWVLGTGILLSRLINGSRKVRALRRSACEIDDPKVQAALAAVGFPTRAPIRFSKRLHSPVVVGPRDTTVILPEKLLAQLDEDQLRCVLAHELTHVRQRDPLIGLIQRLVEAGYWPHPMVHVLNRDLIRAREEVCDNAALHGTTAPRYADTLLTVALGMSPQHATLGIGLMTKRWRLEERVKGLLDPHRRLTTTMNTRHLAFVLVALAAGTAIIAGAHVVATPNPPSLQQQSLDLYSHYNPKTKKVTVTSKITQLRPAKQVKAVKLAESNAYMIIDGKNASTGLPKGGSVRVRYAPSDANIFQMSPKVQKKGALQIQAKDGKTEMVLLGNVSVNQTSRDDAVVNLTTRVVKLPQIVTVLAGKSADTFSYTIQSDQVKGKVDFQPVILFTTTTKDGKSETVTTTTQKDVVLSQTPGLRYEVKTDGPSVKVLTVQGGKVLEKPAQSSGTAVLTPTVGELRYEVKSSTFRPSVVYTTPQLKLDTKDIEKVRVYLADPSRTFITAPKFSVSRSQPRVYQVQGDFQVKRYATTRLTSKPSETTVYIDGDHIRVVGDNIKVVHVDSKAKKVTKPKGK